MPEIRHKEFEEFAVELWEEEFEGKEHYLFIHPNTEDYEHGDSHRKDYVGCFYYIDMGKEESDKLYDFLDSDSTINHILTMLEIVDNTEKVKQELVDSFRE